MKKKLYIKTTHDKYELPIAVAESTRELAEMLGTTRNCVSSCFSHNLKGWHIVEIEEDEVE